MNLAGWYLTDDIAHLTQWSFPSTNLPPKRYLIVFASGANRRFPGSALHTNFKLNADGEDLALTKPDGTNVVSYFAFGAQLGDVSQGVATTTKNEVDLLASSSAKVWVPTTAVPGWFLEGFDDSSWRSVAGAIGFDTNITGITYTSQIETDLSKDMFGNSKRSVAFLRVPFVIANPSAIEELQFSIQYDDGFVAYLNGREIARRNVNLTNYNSFATNSHPNSLGVVFEIISTPGLLDLLKLGTNVLAIQGFNRAATDGDFFISPRLVSHEAIIDPTTARFFATPTPNAANVPGLLGISGDVRFSGAGGTFTNDFLLELSAANPSAGGVIRYTLDRSVPNEGSLVYSSPLTLTNTTQIRARTFEPGQYPGAVRSETYLRLNPNVLNFSSDLPILVIHSLGGGAFGEDPAKPCFYEIHEPYHGRSSLVRPPDVVARGSAKWRGSSTGGQPKHNYAVELWDEENNDRKIPLLGLPSGSDWVLYAPNGYDTANIHNPLADEMSLRLGRYASRTRFVEVFLNEGAKLDGTASLGTTNYNGLYVLMEKLKISPDRIDMDRLQPTDLAPPEVSGGYLLKIDRADPGDTGFSAGGETILYVDPKESEIKAPQREPQRAFLQKYFDDFATTLNLAFVDANIIDFLALEAKLERGSDPVSQYLWSRFTDFEKALLASTSENLALRTKTLTSALNKVLTGPPIYDPARFAGVNLSAETRSFMGVAWVTIAKTRFNRLLIEDTYPQEISKKPSFNDPVEGFYKFVDADSWIDSHLLNVITFNVDAYRLSGYFYKPRQGKIHYGPVWDFDRTLGSADGRDGNPFVWRSRAADFGTDFWGSSIAPYPPLWWGKVFGDLEFFQRWIDRYQDLRRPGGPLNTETLHALCDSLFTQILEAQKREQAKWGALFQSPRTGVVTYEGGYTFNFNKGFQSEIEFQKKWLKDRAFFMDTNFLDRPIFSADGGRVQPGFSLSLSGPAGASIYYTLDGSDPRLRGGAVAAGAALYAGPILVNANARVAARSFDANHRNLTGEHNPPLSSPWSGLAAATLVVTTPPLIVSEIMYHPEASAGSSPYPQEDFEYVEVKNTGSSAYGLGGAAFVNGIEFTFPRVTLPAGERILVVRNRAAFESRYGVGRVIAGEFIGSLDNAGERLVLVGPLREPVVDFTYNNSWYPITDGYGFSLVVVNENAAFENWSQAANWRASSSLGGSPDAGDAAPPAISAILISEILTASVPLATDAIELWNPTTGAVDVTGWYLTDDPRAPKKFRIPNRSIPANGYVVFTETDFNPNPGSATRFAFQSDGDEVYLFSGDAAGALTGYRTGFGFGAAAPGVTFGRLEVNPQLLPGETAYPAQIASTLGAANAGPRVGPLVISEVMYHPRDVSANGAYWDDQETEFIEIRNVTAQPVELFDRNYPAKRWRLRSAVDFPFPANVVVPAQGYILVVNFNPATEPTLLANFRSKYGVPDSVLLFGPYQGKLDNTEEDIRLQMPGKPPPDKLSDGPYILVDQVHYHDDHRWPTAADGVGFSLQRVDLSRYGNDPGNWIAAAPTAAAANRVAGPAPILTAQPKDVVVEANAPANLSVVASGSGALSFQWRHEGRNVSTQTNAALTLAKTQEKDSGTYTCVIYTLDGFVESQPARLGVLIPATITSQPDSLLLGVGASATFKVSARGSGTLSYQWRFNGADIPNANASSFSIGAVDFGDEGSFTCVVRNDIGSSVSQAATLSIQQALTYLLQPASITAVVGENVLLSFVGVGTGNLGYRWRHRGTNLTGLVSSPVPMIASSLELTNVQTNQAGTYTVQLLLNRLASSAIVSSNAILTVLADGDHDGIADIWEAANGLSASDPSDAGKDTDGDSFTNLQEYRAGTNLREANDYLKIDSITISNSLAAMSFQAKSNKTYSIQIAENLGDPWTTVTNIGASPDAARTVVVADPYPTLSRRLYRLVTPMQPHLSLGPIFLINPASQQASASSTVIFTALAVGQHNLTYRWQRNGSDLPGQTAPTLVLLGVQAVDEGEYKVIATGVFGSTTSVPAQLTIAP